MDEIWEDEEDFGPSKSELKRRMSELQKLAGELSSTSDEVLFSLDLPESLVDSLKTAGRLKSSNARNRQLRHAGKLLDKCGEETIDRVAAHFETQRQKAQSFNRRHHLIENWRDKLVESPNEGVSELLDAFPETDRQEIRTLARLAAKEKQSDKPPTQQRRLFVYLRDRVIKEE